MVSDAAGDVLYLLEMHEIIRDRLTELGRLGWADAVGSAAVHASGPRADLAA